ncbi:MAG TPA: nuclear transport factor 2 family protein [Solirubrobacteraceae bacterium]|jgi:ketosteroid isomerase-like protein|nr:nuclear transport factor 2 family protein [Solirubrobacteraceae bacterium]
MTSANLDIVRSIYADWERGDFSSAAWADPEIEFAFAGGLEPGSWRGLAGMAEGYREWLRAWEGFRAEPEEYLVLDGERILVLVRNSGRGRTSGLELEQRSVANLFHLQRGKVIRVVVYLERGLAFADLGLDGESGGLDEPKA